VIDAEGAVQAVGAFDLVRVGTIKYSCRAGAYGACVIDVSTTPQGLNPMSARERRTQESVGAGLTRHRLACITRVMHELEIGEATTASSERAREAGVLLSHRMPGAGCVRWVRGRRVRNAGSHLRAFAVP
jgi:ferredoxin